MNVRRGVALTVAHTLGPAATSTLGSHDRTDSLGGSADAEGSSGPHFVTRWPDDLALLVEHGVADVRLSFDWSRLQPRPGDLDGEWVEWYGDVVDAAHAIGLCTWACLLDGDGGTPRWLDNEGGLHDTETIVRWWPRWVERIADEFGDRIDGWIPAVRTSPDLPTRAWHDTWGLLRGDAPLTVSVGSDDLGRAEELRGSYDLVGSVIELADEVVDDPDERRRLAGERWADQLGRAAEVADRRPIVSDVELDRFGSDLADPAIDRLIETIDGNAADDSGDDALVDHVFVGPFVSTDDSPALFDRDRAIRSEGSTYLDVGIS